MSSPFTKEEIEAEHRRRRGEIQEGLEDEEDEGSEVYASSESIVCIHCGLAFSGHSSAGAEHGLCDHCLGDD